MTNLRDRFRQVERQYKLCVLSINPYLTADYFKKLNYTIDQEAFKALYYGDWVFRSTLKPSPFIALNTK